MDSSVGVATTEPSFNFSLRRRTTFSTSACSDSDIPILVARRRIERLKWADPVKYIMAQARSCGGTTMMSNLRCLEPSFGSLQTPRYF